MNLSVFSPFVSWFPWLAIVHIWISIKQNADGFFPLSHVLSPFLSYSGNNKELMRYIERWAMSNVLALCFQVNTNNGQNENCIVSSNLHTILFYSVAFTAPCFFFRFTHTLSFFFFLFSLLLLLIFLSNFEWKSINNIPVFLKLSIM